MKDARQVLGVAPNAGDEEIRAAYLSKVKEFPPDQAPEQFELIRDAYEFLRDPRKRARALFSKAGAGGPLASLLDGHAATRVFAGPQPWREVLKNK